MLFSFSTLPVYVQSVLRPHSLRKHEILRKRELIAELFRSRKKLKGEHVKLVFSQLHTDVSESGRVSLVLFAVSRRAVPHAVRRNRIRRLMKEAYRLEKTALADLRNLTAGEDGKGQLCLAFVYVGDGDRFPELAVLRKEIGGFLHAIRSDRA